MSAPRIYIVGGTLPKCTVYFCMYESNCVTNYDEHVAFVPLPIYFIVFIVMNAVCVCVSCRVCLACISFVEYYAF